MFCIKVLTAKEKAVNRDLHTFIQKSVVLSSPVELQFLFFLRLFQNVDSSNSRCIWLSCLSSDCMAWKDLFIQSAFKFVSDGSSHNGLQNLSNSPHGKFVSFFLMCLGGGVPIGSSLSSLSRIDFRWS